MRHWKYYVYELADASGVFYVGKGSGNRIKQTLSTGTAEKLRRALNCRATIVAYFKDEADAFEHESERMNWYDGLVNVSRYQSYGLTIDRLKEMAEHISSFVYRNVAYVHPVYGPLRKQMHQLFENLSEEIKKCLAVERVKALVALLEFVTAKLLRCLRPLSPEESRLSITCST